MRVTDSLDRFLSVGALAARTYLGYKAITVAERRFHIRDADERGRRHHGSSARPSAPAAAPASPARTGNRLR